MIHEEKLLINGLKKTGNMSFWYPTGITVHTHRNEPQNTSDDHPKGKELKKDSPEYDSLFQKAGIFQPGIAAQKPGTKSPQLLSESKLISTD